MLLGRPRHFMQGQDLVRGLGVLALALALVQSLHDWPGPNASRLTLVFQIASTHENLCFGVGIASAWIFLKRFDGSSTWYSQT